MSNWNPVWRVKINGVQYTDAILSNLTITSGRSNVYEQAQAGYVSISLINLNQTNIVTNINDSITIEIQDSTAAFVPLFGGWISDVSVVVTDVGSVAYSQTVRIIALGILAKASKILTNGVLAKDHDGDQIYDSLYGAFLNEWSEVPPALQWNTYDPTVTWANAENLGLGEIDRPGQYELANRASSRTDIYTLISALATSGLGYLYENAQGQICYADADHRRDYLAANGYVELSANEAVASGLTLQTRAGDVRNAITLKYGSLSTNDVSATDPASMVLFGELGQVINTTIFSAIDAQAQADFYLLLRAYPRAMFNSISYQLTNSELSDADRDSLINIFMGMPVRISNMPNNMGATFNGFIEGWTFRAAYNELSITALLSPLPFSVQSTQWQDVLAAELWNTITPTLTWQDALVVF